MTTRASSSVIARKLRGRVSASDIAAGKALSCKSAHTLRSGHIADGGARRSSASWTNENRAHVSLRLWEIRGRCIT